MPIEPVDNLEVASNLNEADDIEHSHTVRTSCVRGLFLNNADIIDSPERLFLDQTIRPSSCLFLNDLIKTRHNLKVITNDRPIIKVNNIKTYHKVKGTK